MKSSWLVGKYLVNMLDERIINDAECSMKVMIGPLNGRGGLSLRTLRFCRSVCCYQCERIVVKLLCGIKGIVLKGAVSSFEKPLGHVS